jgi:hypothetical protein
VSRPEVFDDARWVTAFGYEGRLFLGVNPHVHVGRIAVWSDALGLATRISFGDVIEASVEARAWLDGYLAVDPRSVSQSAGCGWRGSCGRGRCVVVGCCSS